MHETQYLVTPLAVTQGSRLTYESFLGNWEIAVC